MPRHTTLTVTDTGWTELTANDVISLTFQNQHHYPVLLSGTTGATPTDDLGAVRVPSEALFLNEALADLFPGISATRVFSRATAFSGQVLVSHA